MAESTLKQKFWEKPESFSDTSHINWYLKMLVWLMYENKIFHNVIFFLIMKKEEIPFNY